MAAGEERLFTAAEWPSSWSPDGKLLAYTTPSLATKGDIWVVAREPDAEPLPVARTGFNEVGPVFSPDDLFIAHVLRHATGARSSTVTSCSQ